MKQLQILIVEDSPTQAKLLKESIRHPKALGNTVEISLATSLQEAIKHLLQQHTDVILLDLMLEDSQGLETLRRVQEVASYATVIVVTGIEDDAVHAQCTVEGAEAVLKKGSEETYAGIAGLIATAHARHQRSRAENHVSERLDAISVVVQQTAVTVAEIRLNVGEIKSDQGRLTKESQENTEFRKTRQKIERVFLIAFVSGLTTAIAAAVVTGALGLL